MLRRKSIVADSSPIITLAVIDQLWILTHFFVKVRIPHAVWDELVSGEKKPEEDLIRTFFRNRIKKISQVPEELISTVDRGEAEAITLYQESKADLLLIDDKKARQVAEARGIVCIGSLALLVKAKEEKTIKSLRPLFNELLANNRYFSTQLLDSLLLAVGEAPLER